jgi:hypothetical protein
MPATPPSPRPPAPLHRPQPRVAPALQRPSSNARAPKPTPVKPGYFRSDLEYKEVFKKVNRIYVALPIAIYLTYELWQRRFNGKEQKKLEEPLAARESSGQ